MTPLLDDDDELHPVARVALWNAGAPIGTPVLVVIGEPSSSEPHYLSTTTTSEAWVYGTPRRPLAVVRVDRLRIPIELSRVTVDARRLARVPAQLSLPQSQE